VIWAHGEVDGGTLGQLLPEHRAAEWCALMDRVSAKPIRWTLIPVASGDSREAWDEAQIFLAESLDSGLVPH